MAESLGPDPAELGIDRTSSVERLEQLGASQKIWVRDSVDGPWDLAQVSDRGRWPNQHARQFQTILYSPEKDGFGPVRRFIVESDFRKPGFEVRTTTPEDVADITFPEQR